MSGWSKVPQDLQRIILRRVNTIDRIKIGAVCKWWQTASLERPTSLPPQIPLLIFRYVGADLSKRSHFYMFSVSHNKFYLLDVPDINTRYCICCGSSQGWLVMADADSRRISLINPITKAEISLAPSPSVAPEEKDPEESDYNERYIETNAACYWVRKIVLSSFPRLDGNRDCVAMALYGESEKLAFCRPGETAWTSVDDEIGGYCDLICYDGQFYAVDTVGNTVVCDLDDFPRTHRVGKEKGLEQILNGMYYLVESAGELLVVTQTSRHEIKVYKLDRNSQVWSKVESLGDCTLFLSSQASYSVLSSNYPGLKGNCIYFTTDDPKKRALMYNLEDDTSETFCHVDECLVRWNTGVWISPSLW